MRIKRVFFLVFLLGLYLVPANLSYNHVAPSIGIESQFILSLDGNSWLEGWDYRRQIPLTGSAGAGTNYQIILTLSYNAKMQTDFDDIRVTAYDGNTSLDYWFESKVDSGYVICWVEVTDNLDSNQVIYLYYGNDAVSTTSNITETFLFADDFNDGTIDGEKWFRPAFCAGSAEETGGALVLTGDTSDWETRGGKVQYGDDYAFRMKIKTSAESNYWHAGFDERSLDGSDDGNIDAARVTFSTTKYYGTYNGTEETSARTTLYTSYQTMEIRRNATHLKYYELGSEVASFSTHLPQDDCGLWFGAYGSGHTTSVDWSLVRKFVDVEPLAGSLEDEELYSEWSPIEWQEVGEAILIFSVPFDYWALNMILIFGGLILMLVSVCIIAVKVRDRTINNDSGVLLLFLFCVGWGLFIGGTIIG